MHNRAILLESNRLENQLINFQIEGALLEVMKNDFMARVIIAEHRKIEKYALQLGLVNKHQINEGLGMDIFLGVGQAVGSIPGLNLSGAGAAFGVAGVLWYGKEMLNSSGFDFAMNLMFCLFSAAAIEPTGIGGEAGTIAKVLKPFAALGQWARSLGTLTLETAAAAYKGLSGVSRALVTGAVKAEGPIMRSFGWIQKTIMPRITTIFESIKGMVKGKPGAEMFGKIAERVSTGATGAFAAVKGGFTSLINFGRMATGKALGTTAAADASLAAARAGGRQTAASATKTAAYASLHTASNQAATALTRLATTKAGAPLRALISKTPGEALGVLSLIAKGDTAAINAIAKAAKQAPGFIPDYLKAGISAQVKMQGLVAQSSSRLVSAEGAAAAAQAAAQKAAATAAGRVAAAKTGAARLGAGAVKAAGSSQTQ